MRIRWRGVGRLAAIVGLGLLSLRLVPGLLSAPEPPPLAADVGLPKAAPVEQKAAEAAEKPRSKTVTKRRPAKPRRKVRPKVVPDAPASSAVMGTRRRHHKPRRAPKPPPAVVESPPPPVEYTSPPPSEYVPEAPPAAAPERAPTPPPVPADGSQEFAPR